MTKRRSLADGLKSTPKADPKRENEFVYRPKETAPENPKAEKPTPPPAEAPTTVTAVQPEQPTEQPVGRSSLTTRLRADIGASLKRASLERQLAGQAPHTVQDLIELVLEPWLKANGYLK
jgi:hypothetical protein